MKGPAPLRFLALVMVGWVGFRLIALAPDWTGASGVLAEPAPAAPRPPVREWARAQSETEAPVVAQLRARFLAETIRQPRIWPRLLIPPAPAQPALESPQLPIIPLPPAPPLIIPSVRIAVPLSLAAVSTPLVPRAALLPGRWSASAWLLLRRSDGGANLAQGGTLGGSQAGARLAYRVNDDPARPLALSARIYAPLERPQGAEAAIGVDWRPVAGLPVHILAERRERIGREGRSDFALTLYGGAERRLLRGRLRLEAYGQAGAVGLRERDLFIDGSLRAGLALGPGEVGAGLWGGAQPGAARLDAGPQVTTRFAIGQSSFRASAEWRFRVAGDAAPGSGPAVSIGADF
jgi:hypothetical protein